MNDDVIESTAIVLSDNNSLNVTRESLDDLASKRSLLKEFVRGQLKEGIKGDYAIIPYTEGKSLLQPGAEKLCMLFGLRAEFELLFKEIDLELNFVMVSYKCRIFHIKSGKLISECDAVCNSQEKKYAEKSEWTGKTATTPATKKSVPQKVTDIMHTLFAMCQKRAFVGATKKATGASDFFTQDIDDVQDAKTAGIVPDMKGNVDFVVEGKKEDTTANKETLRQMGGKWNPGLSKWVFSNALMETMEKVNAISGLKAVQS
jgi:hypothetical protein